MNNTSVIGNLGNDPELKYLDNDKGTCICNFSIAVPVYDKRKNEDVANWISCKAIGKNAENIGEYFRKGSKIGITGELRNDVWEKDGVKHSKTYILVSRFDFLTKKEDEKGQQKYGEIELSDDLIGEDEIPFN